MSFWENYKKSLKSELDAAFSGLLNSPVDLFGKIREGNAPSP